MNKFDVLWIEDSIGAGLAGLATLLLLSRRYRLQVASNASDAMVLLERNTFDAIIADVRLPPGTRSEWVRLYQHPSQHDDGARLGLRVIEVIVGASDAIPRPAGLQVPPDRIGVLSVEALAELRHELDRLGITHFRQKKAWSAGTELLDLADAICLRTFRSPT